MSFNINTLVPELWCSDFQASLEFYTVQLGFEVAQQRGSDPHAYLSFQAAQIMLAHWTFDGSCEPWHPTPMEYPFGRGINFQFMVDGVQAIYEQITRRGVAPFLDIHDAEIWKTDCMDKRRQFMVLDPDGYVLRFAESLSTRPIEDRDIAALNAQYHQGAAP